MNANSVQLCARCGAQWPVQGQPIQWCPRCQGVLFAPAPIDAPARRRNYRWVVRRPDGPTTQPRRRPARLGPTPAYRETPRWGLLDPPPALPSTRRRRGFAGLADRAPYFTTVAAVLFAVAGAAEIGRYIVLLYNRTRLIDPLVLALSDTAVWMMSILALLAAVVAAVAAVGWLAAARRRTFDNAGRRDPRSLRTLALGCLIPVVNLAMPGVFLTELTADATPKRKKLIRTWWCAWVFGGAMTIAALAWRFADSLQAKVDGVFFTALTDLVAMGVAVLTIMVMRDIDGQDAVGRALVPKRWLPATGPAHPVIEPIRPVAKTAQQEVVAK
ncbi:DUF4328 domain-containing protein [Antrihabitans cavernicola]|uniref:DUF4328 domain-containing protein n=1 Tax=Antrihabitans cavernicola TaxID=2495913 RepID=A0A5A7SJD2_9NOCA|nr:DUF4328 domain-containing protein [Spelaeibacter cavernicola]KAA0024743.1 DUF4328 domain-containing protein [Spelaeibacter cavernicola]